MTGPARALSRTALHFFSWKGIDVGAALFTQFLLAIWLGSGSYGLIASVLATTVILAPILTLGLGSASVKFLPADLAAGRTLEALAFVRTLRNYLSALSLIALVLALILAYNDLQTFAAIAAAAPAATIVLCGSDVLRALGDYRWAFVGPPFMRLLLLAQCVAIMIGSSRESALRPLIFAVSIAYVGSAALVAVIARRRVLSEFGNLDGASRLHRHGATTRRWAPVAGPLWVTATVSAMSANAGVLILAAFVNLESAGRFGIAQRVASVLGLFCVAVNSFALPEAVKKHASGDAAGMREILRIGRLFALGSTGIGCLAICVAGPHIDEWLGPEFGDVYTILLILATGYLTTSFLGPYRSVAGFVGHQGALARIALAVSAAYLFMVAIAARTGSVHLVAAAFSAASMVELLLVSRLNYTALR